MKRAGIAELKKSLSKYLAAVKAGGEVPCTRARSSHRPNRAGSARTEYPRTSGSGIAFSSMVTSGYWVDVLPVLKDGASRRFLVKRQKTQTSHHPPAHFPLNNKPNAGLSPLVRQPIFLRQFILIINIVLLYISHQSPCERALTGVLTSTYRICMIHHTYHTYFGASTYELHHRNL